MQSDDVPELALDEAWQMLSGDPDTVLLDVRTEPEWAYVGRPDLTGIGKDVRFVEWIRYPDGARNPDFVDQATGGLDPAHPVLVLCRSGARSRAAAGALNTAGYRAANVTAGFEGDLDEQGHRTSGWKGAGLPWRQS